MSNQEDIVISIGQNVLSAVVIATTFHWDSLIPAADRIVEWILGAAVAVSILVYNIVRIYQALKKKP